MQASLHYNWLYFVFVLRCLFLLALEQAILVAFFAFLMQDVDSGLIIVRAILADPLGLTIYISVLLLMIKYNT